MKRFLIFPLIALIAFAFSAFGQCDPDRAKSKAEFNRASPELRAAAVITHLNALRLRDGINAEQLAVVGEVISQITPDIYNDRKKTPLLAGLLNRLEKAFEGDEWKGSLALGEEAKLLLAKRSLREPTYTTVSAVMMPDCECARSTKASGECMDYPCNSVSNCNQSTWGCGTLWWYACDKLCGSAP